MFPNCWKTASITPIFKEGSPSDPSNYRPIAILPCMGKLLERIAHTQLYSYIEKHNVLNKCQAGFRRGYSTGTCLVDLLEDIYQGVDGGDVSGVLFLDLKKAFDTVNHDILINKLHKYGIRWSAQSWTRSYLSGRSQVTRVGATRSAPLPVMCGVPQGSILGPLLFSLYINDLPYYIPAKLNLYADDTAITVFGKTGQELKTKLENSSTVLSIWFRQNRLSLNTKKTKVMLFGTRQSLAKLDDFVLRIDGKRIESVSKFKYLGVMLDPTLSFHDHVSYIQSKTLGKIKVLGRARSFLSQELCLSLYRTLVLPLFDFNDHVYDCLTVNDSYTLQKLQNTALRSILRVDSRTSISEIHTLAGFPYLCSRRFGHTAVEMYKVVHELAPDIIRNRFTWVDDVSSVHTRAASRGDFYIPNTWLQQTRHSFVCRGGMTWNGIPLETRSARNVKEFKKWVELLY